MLIKINKRLTLKLSSSDSMNLKIKEIIIDNNIYTDGYYFDKGTVPKFIHERIKNQINKEYQEFMFENLYNTSFYEDRIYPRYYSRNSIDIKHIENRYYNFDFSKILEGKLIIFNNEFGTNRLKMEYNFFTDTFDKNVLDFASKSTYVKDNTNKWILLALEQYKRGIAPTKFTELNKILDFFQGKKTVKVIFSDGKEVKEDLLSLVIFDRYKEKIKGFKYNRSFLNIDYDLIKCN